MSLWLALTFVLSTWGVIVRQLPHCETVELLLRKSTFENVGINLFFFFCNNNGCLGLRTGSYVSQMNQVTVFAADKIHVSQFWKPCVILCGTFPQ